MYIAGAIIAALVGVIVWQWLGNSTLKLKLANTETDLAQCQVELEKRRKDGMDYYTVDLMQALEVYEGRA